MDFLILLIAVVLLSLFLSGGLLVAFINFGVLPRPEADELARKLYWRRDIVAEPSVQTATSKSMAVWVLTQIVADELGVRMEDVRILQESPRSPSGTDTGVFLVEGLTGTQSDVFSGSTASGEEVLVKAA